MSKYDFIAIVLFSGAYFGLGYLWSGLRRMEVLRQDIITLVKYADEQARRIEILHDRLLVLELQHVTKKAIDTAVRGIPQGRPEPPPQWITPGTGQQIEPLMPHV
jgi:hypothetical protein